MAVVVLALTVSATVRSQRAATPGGFDPDISDIAGPARSVGQPGVGKTAIEPSQSSGTLALVDTEAEAVALRIGESPALSDAAQLRFDDLEDATEANHDLCAGVPRPTATEDIIDTEAFRIVDADVVVDVRITEFDQASTVDRVLQASRAAWESCNGAGHESGGTVDRVVLPFVSLSGTAGVNLQSALRSSAGQLESSSQTLAIPSGHLLLEVRSISNGELSSSVDAVQILDDVEVLR